MKAKNINFGLIFCGFVLICMTQNLMNIIIVITELKRTSKIVFCISYDEYLIFDYSQEI